MDNIMRVGLNYQFHRSDYGFRKSSGTPLSNAISGTRLASSLA
jgi:hypothetical protein